jgi:hypothetical protein
MSRRRSLVDFTALAWCAARYAGATVRWRDSMHLDVTPEERAAAARGLCGPAEPLMTGRRIHPPSDGDRCRATVTRRSGRLGYAVRYDRCTRRRTRGVFCKQHAEQYARDAFRPEGPEGGQS